MRQLRPIIPFCVVAAALATSAAQANPGSSQPSAPVTSSAPDSASTPSAVIAEYAPPPAEFARAKAYANAQHRHFFVNAFYGFLVLLVLLRWRVAPAMRNLAERVSARRVVQLVIFAPLILLIIALLGMPSDAWDHALDRAFGLSVQAWPAWVGDWITNQIVTVILGSVFIGILYAVIRRSPRRWWFYFWLASMPVLVAFFFLKPLVIDPLFYTFKPLAGAQPVLVAEIQKVTRRGGIEIPPERMFVMNASSKQTALDAYVTGFGSSKRVVVWDTMLAKSTVPETLFVFGHEMGHYVLLHIPKEMAIDEVILLFLLYVGYRLAIWMLGRWKTQWAIRDLADWASFPALFLLLTLLVFLATPAFNAVSRHFEHEADRYGLEVIHGIVANPNQLAAQYFEKSGEINLSDPDPDWFTKMWFFDHPTRPERVHFVATYDPWSEGKEPLYVK